MTRQKSFMRYFLVALLAIVSMVLFLAACNSGGKQYNVTWTVDENATVSVEGYKELPQKVKKGEKLVLTIETKEGYVVDAVRQNDKVVNANSEGKYVISDIAEDKTISVKTKLQVTGIKVSKAPDKLTYEAGEALNKEGMEVQLEYAIGEPKTITDYRIRYQGGKTSFKFELGDTWFKVYYEDTNETFESDPVELAEPAAAVVRLDAFGGTVSEEYVNALKENEALKDIKSENGIVSFKFTEALTEPVALPMSDMMSKGEQKGDYYFMAWRLDDDGDWLEDVSIETKESVCYVALWDNILASGLYATYELDGGTPYLVVKGEFNAADSVYLLFNEGNRKIFYKTEAKAENGKRDESFTLRFNMLDLVNAKAQDNGSFVGPWLDILVAHDVDGRTEKQSIIWFDMYENRAIMDDVYRYAFAQHAGTLKAVISVLTPYTYTMSVDNTDDVLTLTIKGNIVEKALSTFVGKFAHMDWWINANVGVTDVEIDEDGAFEFTFTLDPKNGFILDTLGYAHFSILESAGGAVLYKDGNDGNLLANADVLLNRDELTKHTIPHGDFGGNSLMVSNAEGTLIYYVGIPNWDAIVIYGHNPKAPKVNASGDVELKVDNYENPTKVYYVVKLTVENLTEEDVFGSLVLGNTDGMINVYKAERERSRFSGNDYVLWFDVTAYNGAQLWPNLYLVTMENDTAVYTQLAEVGGDNNGVSNGRYAIVNGVKYSIDSRPWTEEDAGTYGRPILVTGAPAEGETNPPETDPDNVKKELAIDGASFTLTLKEGVVYVSVEVTAYGFANADELKASIMYGNTDPHDAGEEDDFVWKTPCVLVETLEGGNYRLWFDVTDVVVDIDGRLWSNLFLGEEKLEIKDPTLSVNGQSVTLGSTVYTVECTGNGGTWTIPCLTLKEVGEPEYAVTTAYLLLVEGKPNLVLAGTYENYADEDLQALLEEIYFDLQGNPYYVTGSWDGDWERRHPARFVTVENGTWEMYFDLSELDVFAYTAHLGGTGEDNAVDLKVNDVTQDGMSVTSHGYKYILVNKYGEEGANDDGKRFWGNVGIVVEDVTAPVYTATKADLKVEDGKVYFVVSGTFSNYVPYDLEKLLNDIYFDLQKRGDDWAAYNTFARTVNVEVEGTWSVMFDVTELPKHGNPYTGHFGASDIDLKLSADQAQDGKTVELNGVAYTLVNKPGATDEANNWGCVSLRVAEVGAKSLTFTGATLESNEENVWLVLAANFENYTEAELKTITFYEKEMALTVEKVEINGGTVKLYFNFTNVDPNGEWWWGHWTINGEDKGDVKCPVTASEIVLGGKKYELKTEWDMPIVIVTNA